MLTKLRAKQEAEARTSAQILHLRAVALKRENCAKVRLILEAMNGIGEDEFPELDDAIRCDVLRLLDTVFQKLHLSWKQVQNELDSYENESAEEDADDPSHESSHSVK